MANGRKDRRQLRLTIGRELCLPPSQIPLCCRTGRCGRAFARRFHEPKFNKLPSVGCTCRGVEEREDRHPAANPARIAESYRLNWSAYGTNLIYNHTVVAKTRFFVIELSH
jgi:hypothetical protein